MRKVQAEKCIEAAKILAKEKPLTIDDKATQSSLDRSTNKTRQ